MMKKNIKKYMLLGLLGLPFGSFAQEIPLLTTAVPENFRNSQATDTTTVADMKWGAFFTETDLARLIDAGLQKNNDLQIAEENIKIANLQYKQSKWGNVPQINAGVNAGVTRFSDNSLNGMNAGQSLGQHHIEDYTAGLQFSWEIGIWGKIRNQKKNALAAYMQTAEAKKALQASVVSNISKGFYDLLMLDAQLDIARKTLRLNDSTLFIVGLQFDAGQVTSLAKEQTEAQKLVTAKLIPELEQHIQIQENILSVLTGTFPEAKERSSKLHLLVVRDGLSAGIPAQLLSRRPDVKSAELAVESANAKVGITKANLYPSLTITASAGLNSFELSNWFTIPASLFGAVAGGLTAPLLNGKKLSTQYKIAKAQREQAVIQFRQTVLVAVGEVSNALVKVEKQKQQYAIAKQRVETLKRAIANANMLFKNGMATYLEVIIAQGNLLGAELELASVTKERLSSNVELYRALGGGWD